MGTLSGMRCPPALWTGKFAFLTGVVACLMTTDSSSLCTSPLWNITLLFPPSRSGVFFSTPWIWADTVICLTSRMCQKWHCVNSFPMTWSFCLCIPGMLPWDLHRKRLAYWRLGSHWVNWGFPSDNQTKYQTCGGEGGRLGSLSSSNWLGHMSEPCKISTGTVVLLKQSAKSAVICCTAKGSWQNSISRGIVEIAYKKIKNRCALFF